MFTRIRLGGVSLLLALSLSGISQGEVFVPQVTLVSDPASGIYDPEFDQLGYRMVWQDKSGNLWVANVNPLTGDISPAHGMGELVDTGLYSFVLNGNGPEWVYGRDKAHIVYTANIGGVPSLRAAREDSAGNWNPVVLAQANSRSGALGAPVNNGGPPMISYRVTLPNGTGVTGWRNLYVSSSEKLSNVSTHGGRFVEGGVHEGKRIVATGRFNDVSQLAWIDTQSGVVTQISSDPGEKANPFMWWAPELGEYLALAVVDRRILAIYREIGGQWQRYLSLAIPSRFEFLTSPEILVVNGVSYFAIVAALELTETGRLKHWPSGASEIWIGGIDPANPFFRRVDNPAYDAVRVEPEFLVLNTGVAILYYSEQDEALNTTLLFRAQTGLAE
ncbi:MAG: hypothetical protein ACRET6_04280 [Burkholderiales bacterium]